MAQDPETHTPSLPALFLAFLRLGATAFGGPAMVAYIGRMAVDRRQWLDREAFARGVALCQIIPGATAMQAAAYVGLRVRGMRGALVSYLGFGLPAFCLMLVLSALYAQTREFGPVQSVLTGLRVLVVAILANATLTIGRMTLRRWELVGLAALGAVLFGLGGSPLLVIPVAALIGLLLPAAAAREQAAQPGRSNLRPLLLLIALALAGLAVLFLTRRDLFTLAALFLRIDLLAFGGGFASVPLVYHEVVEVHAWLPARTLLDGIALGQITPGPIVITATFIGYLLHGPLGAVVATASVFLPSFLLVVALTPHFDRITHSAPVRRMLAGVLASFVGLVLSVTLKFGWAVDWTWAKALLTAAAFVALLLKVDLLWVVLAGVVVSVLLFR